jgi:hypothetical protein
MNRRSLLIRTLTGAMSATVFTATGWLMGTRTLTMGPPGPCGGLCTGGALCNQMCGDFDMTCAQFNCLATCKNKWTRYIGCNGDACACFCKVTYPETWCGSCTCP